MVRVAGAGLSLAGSPGEGEQHRDRGGSLARFGGIGSAGEDDRNAGAKHDAGGIGVGQVADLLEGEEGNRQRQEEVRHGQADAADGAAMEGVASTPEPSVYLMDNAQARGPEHLRGAQPRPWNRV